MTQPASDELIKRLEYKFNKTMTHLYFDSEDLSTLFSHIRAQDAEIARKDAALEWFSNQLCENSDACGHLSQDDCCGCVAYRALKGGDA